MDLVEDYKKATSIAYTIYVAIKSSQNKENKIAIYTVNHKKGGSTFVIITLENLDGF